MSIRMRLREERAQATVEIAVVILVWPLEFSVQQDKMEWWIMWEEFLQFSVRQCHSF